MIILLNGLPGCGKGYVAEKLFCDMVLRNSLEVKQRKNNTVVVDPLDLYDDLSFGDFELYHMLMKRQMLETFVSVFNLDQSEFDYYYSPERKNQKFMRLSGNSPREFIQAYAEGFIKKQTGMEFFVARELERINKLTRTQRGRRLLVCSDFGSPGELDYMTHYAKQSDEEVVLVRIDRTDRTIDVVETRKVYKEDEVDLPFYSLVNNGTSDFNLPIQKLIDQLWSEK